MAWAATDHLSLDDDGVLWETLYDGDGEYKGRLYLGHIDERPAVPGHLAEQFAELLDRWRHADDARDLRRESIRTFEGGLF